MPANEQIRIGVDIGGTFTDFVVYDPDSRRLNSFKLLSTPHDPAIAVLEGMDKIIHQLIPGTISSISLVHGSTVATNALLERKGAKTALLTTSGFKDVLQIGRQNRPSLYDLQAEPPPVLVPAELRYEVHERMDTSGQPLLPLDLSGLDSLVDDLKEQVVESVAVCFLFSFLNPTHEQTCTQRLRQAGYFVSASSEILPEFREYERTSTTVANAYVSPVMSRYLSTLQDSFQPGSDYLAVSRPPVHLRVMQSNGGIISINEAQRSGVRCVLSGPAGGVVGAQAAARQAFSGLPGQPQHIELQPLSLITFDMGGTSTDVSLIDGSPQTTSEMVIGGCPIRLAMLDIHTIGAGGGSIARIDSGGSLRVGPESAGADPGPACYGRTSDLHPLPTVTDANLLLGRLSADHFLGGQMRLASQRSLTAISRLAGEMGCSPQQAALGIIDVVNAHMERALRLISVERGFDPRQFTLLSFGGAGGLHATELASRLGMQRVLVPRLASTLSAYGMLTADVVKDYSRTVMIPGDTDLDHLRRLYDPLIELAYQEMASEGYPPSEVILSWKWDVRYRGQSYELTLPFSENCLADFHQAHLHTYSYSRPDSPVEIVNLRLRAKGLVEQPVVAPFPTMQPRESAKALFSRNLYFHSGQQQVPFYAGEALQMGGNISGPAVVLCSDTTILVDEGWILGVGVNGDFVIVNDYAHFTPRDRIP